MKIAVLADSHYQRGLTKIPKLFWQTVSECDLILHAGDIGEPGFLEDLRAFAPVEAVCGNCDTTDLARVLGYKKVLHAAGRRIGLYHGHQLSYAEGLLRPGFFPEEVDVAIYGHTHIAHTSWYERKLLFNPGSIARPRGGNRPSCGFLSFGAEQPVQSEIFYFHE